jgi:hypothetical protein
LLGQWQDELFRLFEIQALEGGHHPGPGVFLMGRENAGSERGAAILENSEPFDLCVIDEAHEVFANIYRRFDRDGNYREDSPDAQTAGRIRGFLRQAPVLLLTATPIQNNLYRVMGAWCSMWSLPELCWALCRRSGMCFATAMTGR